MGRRPATVAFLIAALAVGGLCAAAIFAPAAAQGPIQGVVQASAVVIAVTSLWAGMHNRKVDRVLELHRELTTGQLGDARTRLGWLYRRNRMPDKHLPRLPRFELPRGAYIDVTLPVESPGQVVGAKSEAPPVINDEPSPRKDADRILRYFERVCAAQVRGSLDNRTAALLLGWHAAWWDRAVITDADDQTALPLRRFADWARRYASRQSADEEFAYWSARTDRDFG